MQIIQDCLFQFAKMRVRLISSQIRLVELLAVLEYQVLYLTLRSQAQEARAAARIA